MSEMRPIFIGGAGRSGTTLVVDMLGLHSRVSPIYETDFVVQLADLLIPSTGTRPSHAADLVIRCMDEWTRLLPLRPHNKRSHERYHHGPHYVLFDRAFAMARAHEFAEAVRGGQATQGFRRFLDALFDEHCRLDNKARWANKTPAYVNYLPFLHSILPTLQFIHCVRDGRDVATSVMTRPWGPKNFSEAATWWATKVRNGVAFAIDYPDQCHTVRFEDLVQYPSETLGRVLDWLGEDPQVEFMLQHYRDGAVRLEQSRIQDWQHTVAPADIRVFQSHAGDLLEYFGYAT